MKRYLPYDPGPLPSKAGPVSGNKIALSLDGLPPAKRRGGSIRNPKHRRYDEFLTLRNAAIQAMNGRAWYFGPVALHLYMYGPEPIDRWGLLEYAGGIMDTLDGSSGRTFTYLPIVYEDDCQVDELEYEFEIANSARYEVHIEFL